MKLIVGLGNPDKQYLNTFHNLGFLSADKTAELLGVYFAKQKCKALLAETKING
jgi:PTH1 family peptidyl-tRNA hydrolase